MIRWRLSEVMARYSVTGVQLADKLSVTKTSVSRMRRSKHMPQFTGQRLGQLCDALNDLIEESGQDAIITPADLLDYTYNKNNAA